MRFAIVAFDLYGTLLDVSGLAKRLEPFSGSDAADLLARWRSAQLERTWREKSYEPFDAVTARALEEVAPRLDASTRRRMCETWLSLPAFPDARATLESLHRSRVRRAILSNGTPAMIRSALAAADLDVDEVLSADDVRAYKPKPAVYGLLDRERSLFVSANGWDAEGAKRSGLSVAWIDRGTPPPAVAPDLHVHSLAELAASLSELEGSFSLLPVWGCLKARVLAEAGRSEEATRTVADLTGRGLAALERDTNWLISASLLAETFVRTRDVEGAAQLRRALEPRAAHWAASARATVCFGPLAGPLALLSAVEGDGEEAERYHRMALDRCRAAGARLAAARLEREYAVTGLARRPARA